MPEWIGVLLFLGAAVLSGAKIAHDFGDRGLRGYAMLMVMLSLYAGAVGLAFT
jgi:hypothetical protein